MGRVMSKVKQELSAALGAPIDLYDCIIWKRKAGQGGEVGTGYL